MINTKAISEEVKRQGLQNRVLDFLEALKREDPPKEVAALVVSDGTIMAPLYQCARPKVELALVAIQEHSDEESYHQDSPNKD